jgi:predicted permease
MENDIVDKLSRIRGVTAGGITSSITMDQHHSGDILVAEDHPVAEGTIPPVRRFKFISPGYFRTMGNPLVAGRDLTWTDVHDFRPVVIISENLAREYWRVPSAALGKRIRESPKNEWREIVGVVGDEYDDGVQEKPQKTVYWPLLMSNFWGDETMVRRTVAFAIRSPRTGSAAFLDEVRQAVWAVSPNSPVADVQTLDAIYRKSMARTSFTLVMLAIAGGMALVLGLVGIYGVIAYSVAQRRREIGIRMALGARQQSVSRMFIRHGLGLAAIGVAFGLGAAAGLTRLMASLLFGVSALDLTTYGLVALGLVGAVLIASYLPARRAAAVDPMETLRAE